MQKWIVYIKENVQTPIRIAPTYTVVEAGGKATSVVIFQLRVHNLILTRARMNYINHINFALHNSLCLARTSTETNRASHNLRINTDDQFMPMT